MAGKENPVKAMVLAAKKTLVKFVVELEDNINSLVYGVNTPKIENQLVRLEKQKEQNETIYTKGNEEFPGILSKDQYDENNKEFGEKKQDLLKSAQNPIKNFGIAPITYQVRRINSFNLCNPLTLGINAAFPPGSPVSEGIKTVQGDLKRIQDIFRNFRLISENQTVTAESEPLPIQEGEISLQIEAPKILDKGTILYIQQTNNETIVANMVGIVKNNSISERISPDLSETLKAIQSNKEKESLINSTFGSIDLSGGNASFTSTFDSSLSFSEEQESILNAPINLTSNKNENSISNKQFTGFDLGKLPKKARRKLKKQGLTTNITFEGTGDLQNATFTGTETELESINQALASTGNYTNPNPQNFPEFPLEKTFYTVEIQRFDPFDPPTEKDKAGNTILDADGDPVLQTFTNWQIEYETQASGDLRELAEDLEGISDALRDLGINQLVATLNRLPKNFLGLGKLQDAMLKVALFIDDKSVGAAELSDELSTQSQALSGGLTSQEVIRRSRLLTDFYEKLKPLINFDLSLENIFKKQIQDINKTLRSVVPYEALAKIVKAIKNFVKFVINLVDFVLAILQFLNTLIKVLLIVAKVLKVVIKVINKVALALPNMFITAGINAKFSKIIENVGNGLDTGVTVLEEISKQLDSKIQALQFLRGWLVLLASELAKLQQTFETCASLDDNQDELDLNGALQGLVSVATGIPFPENAVRNIIKEHLETYTPTDLLDTGTGQTKSDLSEFGQVLVTTSEGTIIALPGTVWGFNTNGQIVFGADLISLSTGVNFEETRGQEFRRTLRENFNFYTFNKFKDAKYTNLVENLYAQGIETYAQEIEKISNIDASDKFGNFQETFLGYVIRIQEEKPIEDSPKGETNLTRRRGVAFDIDGKLSVASDLTFSDDLNLIVNETKFRIKRNIDQGIIGVGTVDNQNFPDDDAIKLAETTGANPLAVSNIKSQANNMAANNIVSNQPVDPTPTAMRTGNEPFTEAAGEPANIVNNQSSPNKTINPSELIQQPFAEFISENPSLKKMQDTMKLLQGASMSELSDIMSEPGVFNLSGEELAEKLKSNIVSSINPNPEKIEEIKKKTEIWLEGLEKQTKIDYEQLTLSMHPKQRAAFKPFEVYYEEIEIEELEKWIKFLLSKGYTEEEIQAGIREEKLRDEYKIKFNVKGKKGRILKVKLTRRNERLRNKLK
tara:strand:+ start:4397 stop:7972 length:3576 start_codon:yes stop_codon:yes gene_type:complete